VLLCAATAAGSTQSTLDESDAADAENEGMADEGAAYVCAMVELAGGANASLDALTFVTGLRREPSGIGRDGLALLAQSSEEIGCRSPRMLHAAITLGDVFGMDAA